MPDAIVTAVIAASGAVLLAGATYWFTKKREREAELRREKLEHYKDFVASLSGIISGESTAETQRAFSRACNKLNLVAPQVVLEALQAFQRETKASNSDRSIERHDELMSKLFYEIRRDLGISPADVKVSFHVGLWTSGVPPKSEPEPLRQGDVLRQAASRPLRRTLGPGCRNVFSIESSASV